MRRHIWLVTLLCSTFAFVAIVRAALPALQDPPQWTEFRLQNSNNAVVAGTLRAQWRAISPGGFSSSPTLAGGILYLDDNAGLLTARDPASGRVLWSYQAANPLMSAPIVYGNLVIVGEGNENSVQGSSPSHPILVGAGANALIALDRRSGQVVWSDSIAGSGMPTPAIVGAILVHHNGAGIVEGIDPQSGRVLYSRDLHSIASMVAALPVGKDRFITSGVDENAVWLLNASDGSPVWSSGFSRVASGLGDCPPASDGARVYCNYVMPPSSAIPVQTERAAKFHAYAIDLQTGKRVWDTLLNNGLLPKRNESAIPLVEDGVVYMGSSFASWMNALDARTGALRWRVHTHGPVRGGIAEIGGTLYFGDLQGFLWAIDASTGRVIGEKNEGTPFNVGSPIIAGQTLIIGSRGGNVIAEPLDVIRASHD